MRLAVVLVLGALATAGCTDRSESTALPTPSPSSAPTTPATPAPEDIVGDPDLVDADGAIRKV